jgi:hypothetical protein
MLFMLEPVVTVDGILLTKSGTMTGGTSGGMEARSNKWDDKKIEGWFICIVFMWNNGKIKILQVGLKSFGYIIAVAVL